MNLEAEPPDVLQQQLPPKPQPLNVKLPRERSAEMEGYVTFTPKEDPKVMVQSSPFLILKSSPVPSSTDLLSVEESSRLECSLTPPLPSRTYLAPNKTPPTGTASYNTLVGVGNATSKPCHDDISALDLTAPLTPLSSTLAQPERDDLFTTAQSGAPLLKSQTLGKAAGSHVKRHLNHMSWNIKSEPPPSSHVPPLPPRSPIIPQQIEDPDRKASECGSTSDEGGSAERGPEKLQSPKYDEASPPCTLSDIVRCYGTSFPIDVRIHSGIGVSKRTPELEFLRIHSLSHSPILRATSSSGWNFNIPLNVDMRLALLYEPMADIQAAVEGYTFNGISSVANLSLGPKLLSVTRAWSNADVSLIDGEIIALCEAPPSGGKVQVYSVTEKFTKDLPLDCSAGFTTKALTLCLSVPDIVAYVPHPFPARACVLKYDNGPKCYPSNVIMLNGLGTGMVLNCTSLSQAVDSGYIHGDSRDHMGEYNLPTAFHLPVELPGLKVVLVENVAFGESSKNQVDREPAEMVQRRVTIQERRVIHTEEENLPDGHGDFEGQSKLPLRGVYIPLIPTKTQHITSDYCSLEPLGVSFNTENKEKKMADPEPQQTSNLSRPPLYLPPVTLTACRESHYNSNLPPRRRAATTLTCGDSGPLNDDGTNGVPPPAPQAYDYIKINGAPPPAPQVYDHTKKGAPPPAPQVYDHIKKGAPPPAPQVYDHIQIKEAPPSQPQYETKALLEENRLKNLKRLKRMTVVDVLALLDSLGLGVYKPVFEREHISGCVLSLVNQDVYDELKVSEEHRKILSEVIAGVIPLPPQS